MSKVLTRLRDARGATLAELLVYITLLISFTSIIGAGFFHAVGTRDSIEADGYALNELRRGLGYFAEDVTMAREATASADELTLKWKDYYQTSGSGTENTVTYALINEDLVRSHSVDSVLQTERVVARRVAAVTFSTSLRTVSASLSVTGADGGSKSMGMKAVMKPVVP